MSDAFLAAIPGAVATIVAGIIGAYAVIRKKEPTPLVSGNTPAENEALAAAALKQRRYSKKFASLVAGVGVLLGGVVMLTGFYIGRSQKQRQERAEIDGRAVTQSKSYEDLIVRGITDKKAYVFPSIVMLTTAEKSPDGKSVIEDQHTIYMIHALARVSSSSNAQAALFPEEYDSRHAIRRLPGSEKESVPNLDFPNKWFVHFDAAEGQRESIVTGVEHTRPVAEAIPGGLCMFPTIAKTEDCFCYPNDQDDVIGEVMFIVQSKTLNLNTDGAAQAMLKRANGNLEPIATTVWTLGDGSNIPSTVVARFPDVAKHDIAGIKVRWAKP